MKRFVNMKLAIKEVLILLTSSFLLALAVNFFIATFNLTPGGTTGMAISLSIVTGIEVATTSLLITIPLLIIGSLFLGQNYGLKTLIIVLATPFFINLLPMIKVVDNIIISGVCGGVIVGIAISLAIMIKASTGGTDLIAMLLHKLIPQLKISNWLLIIDGLVVVSSAILTKQLTLAIYSAITLLVINLTIKLILNRGGVE